MQLSYSEVRTRFDCLTSHVSHIAIDAHSVGTGLAGNETYAANLVEALAEVDRREPLHGLRDEARRPSARFGGRWPNVEVRRTLPHTPLVRIPLTLSAELRRRPVDLLHVQYTAPPLAPCPVVATIHDLSFEHLPETFKRRSRMQLRLTVRRTARRAAHVIAPSEYTRRDLIETYGLDPERVTRHHRWPPRRTSGPSATRQRSSASARVTASRASTFWPSGRFSRGRISRGWSRAYSDLRRARGRSNLPQLVLVGKQAWLYGETLRPIEEEGVGDAVLLTGYVSEGDLPALYTGALCFAYPSFFEGFGLPPLEAMRAARPS